MEVIFNIQPMPAWDWRIAVDLFFGGMGVGTFIFALVADWHFQGRYPRLCRTAARLSPVLVIVGLLFLMSELGRPFSFFKVFLTYQPDSVIWWGGWLQTIFLFGSLYYAKGWDAPVLDSSHRVLGWLLSPVALGVGAYHGFLLSAFETRALWSSGSTVAASMLSFITTGMALTLLVYLYQRRSEGSSAHKGFDSLVEEMGAVRTLLGVALIAELVVFFVWYLALKQGDAADQAALAAANALFAIPFWALGIGLGLILPLMLGIYFILNRSKLSFSAEMNSVFLTSSLILIGGFVIRLGIVLGGQGAPIILSLG